MKGAGTDSWILVGEGPGGSIFLDPLRGERAKGLDVGGHQGAGPRLGVGEDGALLPKGK